jgi:Zn finger protein HypA/HybF involved in hydrogenase expression
MKNSRKKTSPIWQLPTDQLKDLVKECNSFSDVLKGIGLNNIGGNVRTLKLRLVHEEIDFSHIPIGYDSGKGLKRGVKRAFPLEDCLIENSTYGRGNVKRRLIQEKLIPYVCKECNQGEDWNGKKLVLVLDHKNGISNDHRLENLRFLCPNCNSQMPTFSGRNKAYKKIILRH